MYIATLCLHHEGFLCSVYVGHCLTNGTIWYCIKTGRSTKAVWVVLILDPLYRVFYGLGPMILTAIMNITASFKNRGAPIPTYYYYYYYCCCDCLCNPARAMASPLTRFPDHTQRRATVGRNPLDEWSARRGDLYLTTQNTQNRRTSMPPSGIRAHDRSRRATVHLCLRLRGHWDRHSQVFSPVIINLMKFTSAWPCCERSVQIFC
jgi:hypothetical protein